MKNSQCIEKLIATTKDFDLVAEALRSCKRSLHNCAEEDSDVGETPLSGWEMDEIVLNFDKSVVVLEHSFWEFPYFDTQIGLYVKDDSGAFLNDLDRIGSYNYYTLIDGECFDDSLVISLGKNEKLNMSE